MITIDELKEIGFVHDEDLGVCEYRCNTLTFRNNVILSLSDEGVITYVREFDNYHGLKTNISSIRQLYDFFHSIS